MKRTIETTGEPTFAEGSEQTSGGEHGSSAERYSFIDRAKRPAPPESSQGHDADPAPLRQDQEERAPSPDE